MDSSLASDDSLSVSPYHTIFIAFSRIPFFHLLCSLIFIFLLLLYNVLEFHFLHDFLHAFTGDRVSLTYASDSHLYHSVVSKCRILHGRYLSTPWLSSPHLQTAFLSIFGRSPPVNYKRQLFNVPDGGTIALDWLRSSDVKRDDFSANVSTPGNEKTPIVIVIPGLTSDSTAAYIKHFAFRMANRGWNVVVSNHRGLGGISLTSECVYNAGWTEDIRRVVGHIRSQHSQAPLYIVGTSIGANVLVKYLGEDGSDVPINGAASICSPWDLLICDRFINRGLVQKFYNKALADGLQGFALLHQSKLSRITDWECIKKSRSVRDFDHYATRILGNFETVDAYYRYASSTKFVEKVGVPLLCISALDDPVCTKEAIPWDECRANRNVVLATTLHGGHLAFYERMTATSLWWVRAVEEFLTVLHSIPNVDVIKQSPRSTAPTPLSSSIDQGPYVSVLEDGMVAAIGDEQTDDAAGELMPKQRTVNVGTNDQIISDKEEAGSLTEKTHKKNGPEADNVAERTQKKNGPEADNVAERTHQKMGPSECYEEKDATFVNVITPVRKCIDCLARQSTKSIWLLAYIAIVTSWPMVRPALSLLFKKRFNNGARGGSRQR